MLAQVFRSSRNVARCRSNVLGKHLDDFTGVLLGRGYSPTTIRKYMRVVEHFGGWLSRRYRKCTIDDNQVNLFLQKHLPVCKCSLPAPRHLINVRAALKLFFAMLRNQGHLPQPARGDRTPINRTISAFHDHLERVCGLGAVTCSYRARYVRQFLKVTFGKGELRFNALVPSDLMRFISDRARTYTPGSTKVIASSLRSYLRFLCLHGLCKHNLMAAVPTIPQWQLSELPPSLNDEDVARLLASFDCKTGTGKRDYAIALCLAHFGLRACDVPLILLESIDWRAGTLRIPSSKTRREILLPLLTPVGRAIAAYLRGGRPKTADQHLFVRHRTPLDRSITPGIVRWIIRRAAKRANVCLPQWSGAHILRHTVATRMIQRGATLKDIADVLGHQSLDTTVVYAKVDLPTLQKVAMPWPEVRHA